MKKYIFIALALLIIPALICFAETIELKSGKIITGKIIEKTDRYIKVDVSGAALTYFLDEIAKIEETPQELKPEVKKNIPLLEKENPPLSQREISSASGVTSKPIPLGKMQELEDYLRKGEKYFTDKQYKEAITEFEKALQIDPNYAITLYYLGYTYYVLGQYQTAMQYYQKVLIVAPNYAKAYVDIGNINVRLNRFEEAISYFNKAMTLGPDNVEAYNGLGFAYTSMSKFQDAVDAFKKAITIKKDNAESYFGLGFVYFSSGQYAEAKENFLKAKEIFMKDGDEGGVKSTDEYLRAVP